MDRVSEEIAIQAEVTLTAALARSEAAEARAEAAEARAEAAEARAEAAEARAEAANAQVAELKECVAKLTAQVEELQSRLGRNSRNSNSPPSTDTPDKKPPAAEPMGKRPKGGQKGHPVHRREILPPTLEVEAAPVCSCGSSDFDGLSRHGLHQVVELPAPTLDVTHVHLLKGTCLKCGKVRAATPPAGQESGFGPNLTALVGELSGPMRLSRRSVRSLLKSFLGLGVSIGGIQGMIDRVSSALAPIWERMGELARSRKVNHVDETSWRMASKRAWIWVMANRGASFFMIHPSRSGAAFKALIGDWKGSLVSDDFGVYIKWEHGRQTCLAHLLRLAKGFAEHASKETAAAGEELLGVLGTIHQWSVSPPTEEELEAGFARLHDWCERHRETDGKLGATSGRLSKGVRHLAAFLYLEGVEPTNNRAERAVRFGVLWRKMSFGSDGESGCRWAERVLTLVASCAGYGVPTYPVIVDAVKSSFERRAPKLGWAVA